MFPPLFLLPRADKAQSLQKPKSKPLTTGSESRSFFGLSFTRFGVYCRMRVAGDASGPSRCMPGSGMAPYATARALESYDWRSLVGGGLGRANWQHFTAAQ